MDIPLSQSPLARSPEVRGGSALCMPNILCFKVRTHTSAIFVYLSRHVFFRTNSVCTIATYYAKTVMFFYLNLFKRKQVTNVKMCKYLSVNVEFNLYILAQRKKQKLKISVLVCKLDKQEVHC